MSTTADRDDALVASVEDAALRLLLDALDVPTLRELHRLVGVAREAEALGAQVRAGDRLVAIFDTASLDEHERDCLAMEVAVQAESVSYDASEPDAPAGHPSVRAVVR